jgi:hypothetical protein
MTKYRVEVITKQRNNIIVDATDEETAIQGFIDLLHEKPEGYLEGIFDTFIIGPDATVEEIKE